MTLGLAQRQGDLLDEVMRFCDDAVAEDSVYALLHRERDNLFGDVFFADLFTSRGRRSVPPSIVACVMVLQKLGGLSDREAVDRFTYDARWHYAAGVGGWDQGPTGFAHTVLVDMRARLLASDDITDEKCGRRAPFIPNSTLTGQIHVRICWGPGWNLPGLPHHRERPAGERLAARPPPRSIMHATEPPLVGNHIVVTSAFSPWRRHHYPARCT